MMGDENRLRRRQRFFCSYSSSLLQTNFHPVRRSFVPKKENLLSDKSTRWGRFVVTHWTIGTPYE